MSVNLLNIADNARIESIKKLKKLSPLKIKKELSKDDSLNFSPSINTNILSSGNEEQESDIYNESPINPSVQSFDFQQQISRKSIGEISNDVRQNIRKKAKSALEVKRGSIQLQKRLLRSKTLTSNIPKQIFENDSDKLDNQIERVIKLGEKYETKKENTNVIDDTIQYEFAVGNFEKTSLIDTNEILFDYTPASPLYISPEKLKQFISIFDDKILNEDIEKGNDINIIDNKNDIKLRRRLGKKFLTNNNTILGMDKNELCENKVLKYNRIEWEETSLVENIWKESKNTQSNLNNSKKRQYENIKISLSKIKLHHHWLFCKEHVLCRKVEEIYELLLYKANIILGDIKKYLTNKSKDEDINDLEKEIEKNVKDYQKTGEEIQYYWTKLCNLREEQGYQKSPLTLTIKEVQEQDLSFFNPIIQDFYRNPIFLINYDKNNIKIFEDENNNNDIENVISDDKMLSKEKELDMYFSFLKKCEWEAQIFFNDIFVCRSKPRNLTKNFEIIFNEEYNLQVHDVPETIVIVLYERFNRGVFKFIAKIGLPLEKEDDEINDEACNHFGTDTVYEGLNGTIGAGGIGRDTLSGVIFTKLDGYGILSPEEVRKRDEHLYTSFNYEDFQLIPIETRLVNDDLFEDDIRIHSLRMRFEKNQLLGSIEKPIPIYANEMDGKYYKVGEIVTEEYEKFGFGIEKLKLSSISHAIKLRTEFIRNIESNKRKIKAYADIVKEETFPNFFSGLSTLFGNRDVSRKLKPMRNEIKKQVTTGAFKFKFIINIQSAINIGEKIDGGVIQSFVEITFQSQVFKTKLCSGKNPKWQETLTISFDNSSLKNKNLNSIIEKFTIRLYDYLIVPLKHDDREVNTIHEQVEYRYLGKVEIPFYTIYMNGKIDGLIPIHRVSFSNGYIFEGKSYLKLMISLDPLIASPIDEHIPTSVSNEDDIIIEKYILWKKRCQLLYPNRNYKGMIFNSQGKSILASRYIHTVKPPPFLDSFSNDKFNLVKKMIDVIKCLPTINDPIIFPGICDLWTNVDQTLTIGCGVEEEHALILICWLFYYNVEAYLVLGNALPEGLRTGYVIVTIEEKLYIINPVEGFIWDIKDSYVPILSIGTIITKNNIYGNIQKHEFPPYMSFDFTREDYWKKLFDNDVIESSLNTIQNETVMYQNISDGLLIELKSSLERDIKTKIDELRQFGIPQWNILVARTLKDIISDTTIIDNHKEIEKRLHENFGSLFKIHAIILKIPFISQKSFITEILSTKIHLNSDIGVQFAVSVHLVPYINNILQCNVGLASLIPV